MPDSGRGWGRGLLSQNHVSQCPARNIWHSMITDSRGESYGARQFGGFVMKSGPNRGAKFGNARKMSYLCNVN